jgi:hypothetical protein
VILLGSSGSKPELWTVSAFWFFYSISAAAESSRSYPPGFAHPSTRLVDAPGAIDASRRRSKSCRE